MGSFMLFDTAAYKLNQDNVERAERTTGRAAANLAEEGLLAAMRKLGIKRLERNEEGVATIV